MATTLATTKRGSIQAHVLDGSGIKAVPLSALTQYDIDRWFAGTAGKESKDPTVLAGRVATLARCVEMRSQAIAGMPRQILNRETGDVLATANFPTPQMDEDGRPLTEDDLGFTVDFDDLWWRAEMAQCLLAESYFFQVKNRARLLDLRWLDPRTIDPKYSAAGVVGFERTSGGRKRPLAVEDVVWFHRPGLKELGPGKAPGQVAARAAGIADYMDMFIETFFERGAMPTTVVFSETRPDTDERNRIKRYLENILTGIGNAFGVEVLNSALRFETLTPPLKDMLLPDIKDGGSRDIAIAMGVPASLIFEGASNFATAQVDDLNLYTKTVVPEARFLERQLNKLLFKKMGMVFQFRPDQLEIFQKQEFEKVAAGIQLYDRGAIDENELRAAGGYQQRAQTAVPAPAATDNTEATQPAATPSVRSRRVVTDAQATELRQWERKVAKRFPEERPYVIPFEPAHLTAVQTAVVRKSLLTAKSKEEVKAAFAAPFRL